ncbi:hypothetical protein IMZ29_15195 [Achromobacter sp. GG226]|uniref:hypothetical protein n=1 Tax=Verticiella alkaliphila TaxID=2779529 RepID=UPI001C0B5E0D|nr:hypothetical protein [Verticiella sp. GG226]MBU4611834.1 hypothetical protein [Verticiella sp. GG226]
MTKFQDTLAVNASGLPGAMPPAIEQAPFGEPIAYDREGQRGEFSSLDDAIAFVEPRAGTVERPDPIWRGVLEALHFAKLSGLPEEVVNARAMLETALTTPPADSPPTRE